MRNKWLVESIAELAFIQMPIRFYGYGMEKGIILIADDDESALVIKAMLEAHLDAVEVKFNSKKEKRPWNYQMGVHVYNKLDKTEKLLEFLAEQEFLPVLVVCGLIPENLVGMGYAFRCMPTEEEFMEAGAGYKQFVDFAKRHVESIKDCIYKRKTSTCQMKEEYKNDGKIWKKFAAVSRVCDLIYKSAGASEEEIRKKAELFCNSVIKEIKAMDRYEGEYDVQDAVRECFVRQAKEGKFKINRLEGNCVNGEVKGCILYDGDYYYVEDSTLRLICAPLLSTVSFVQLKNEMASTGMLECSGNDNRNFTKKKLIWRSYGYQERVRMIWIKKEALMDDEGMLLEDIWEADVC